MRAISGREQGPRYATTASVSSAACERPRSIGRSKRRAQASEASRLGEIALVDGHGRVGPLGTTFFDTLIDENAASHIALGGAYDHPVEDAADKERINESRIHIDFMIGSPELAVDGTTRGGEVVPVLREGAWQI